MSIPFFLRVDFLTECTTGAVPVGAAPKESIPDYSHKNQKEQCSFSSALFFLGMFFKFFPAIQWFCKRFSDADSLRPAAPLRCRFADTPERGNAPYRIPYTAAPAVLHR